MSYQRTWVLLDSINRAFTEPVVTATPGGAGGGASLTPFGAEVTMGTGRPWLRAGVAVRLSG
jgi:molybdate transport system regulatory protein